MFSKASFLIVTAAASFASAETFSFASFADPLHQNNTVARGINNVGQIVGDYESLQQVFTMAFLHQNGTFTTINVPQANYTVATGINNSGEIVGYYADGFSKVHGFMYENGRFTSIDSPNAVGTWISGINNRGQLVGYYSDALSTFHGVIYDGRALTSVDDPEAGVAGSTRFFGINDAGQVVGQATSPISGARGFAYENGQFRTLTDPLNGTSLIPAGINNLGEIAGTTVLDNLSYGFVETGGSFSYFRNPAYTETTVCGEVCVTVPIPIQLSGINDAGEIVGFHSYIDRTTPVVSSFVGTPAESTPVPEPASIGFFAAGLAGIGLLRGLSRFDRKHLSAARLPVRLSPVVRK